MSSPSATGGQGAGAGHTVWLASYPKSGNTWLRAVVTALHQHSNMFRADKLGSGHQPYAVDSALVRFGLDARWLDRTELDRLRASLIVELDRTRSHGAQVDPRGEVGDEAGEAGSSQAILRKTHETYRPGAPGLEPFPAAATRAALLVVRDPRDVACSYAPFFGTTIDEAIEEMARESGRRPPGADADPIGSPARRRTAQPWGSWSSHALSWLSADVPFPVEMIRYEDMQADTAGAVGRALRAVGMSFDDRELAKAVELTGFDRMARSEDESGFRERSRHAAQFFRKGTSGAWRDELTDAQVARIEADHAEVMELLGYEFVTDQASRAALAESRRSVRRHQQAAWTDVPAHLDLTVREGDVPDSLEGAALPRPWIQVTDRQVLVQFPAGAALLVSDGTDAVVRLAERPMDGSTARADAALVPSAEGGGHIDISWVVQGWAVTLATLQRGDLSLHAATVKIDDRVVAIAGVRGAGKSTTAMGLRARGHALLVDDVTLVHFEDGKAIAYPYERNVHLLPDAADALGVDFGELPALAGGRAKAAFRPEVSDEGPRVIDELIVLTPGSSVDEPVIDEVRGGQRLPVLARHTTRDGIAPLVLGEQRYFALLAQLANSVPVRRIRRPEGSWTLDRVLDLIEAAPPERQE